MAGDADLAAKNQEFRDLIHEMEPILEEMVGDFQASTQAWTFVAGGLFLLLMAGLLLALRQAGTRIAASVEEPLEAILAAAQGVARGDLETRLDTEREDEFGEIAASLESVVDAVRAMVSEIEGVGRGVRAGA